MEGSKLQVLPIEIMIGIYSFLSTRFVLHDRTPFLISRSITRYLRESKYFWLELYKRVCKTHNPCISSDDVDIDEIREYCLFRGRVEGIHWNNYPQFEARHELFDWKIVDEKKQGNLLNFSGNSSYILDLGEEITSGFKTIPKNHKLSDYNTSSSRKNYLQNLRKPPPEICFESLDFVYHYSWKGLGHFSNTTRREYHVNNTVFYLWSPKTLKYLKVNIQKYDTSVHGLPFVSLVGIFITEKLEDEYFDILIEVNDKLFFETQDDQNNKKKGIISEERRDNLPIFQYSSLGILDDVVSVFDVQDEEIRRYELEFGKHSEFALIWFYIFKDFLKWMNLGGVEQRLLEASVDDTLNFFEIVSSNNLQKKENTI